MVYVYINDKMVPLNLFGASTKPCARVASGGVYMTDSGSGRGNVFIRNAYNFKMIDSSSEIVSAARRHWLSILSERPDNRETIIVDVDGDIWAVNFTDGGVYASKNITLSRIAYINLLQNSVPLTLGSRK